MQKNPGNIKNSTWNLANILLYPVAFLALTPLFIDFLGEDEFGIWMLVNSYVYIAVHIVSFGMGNSITAHMAEALGKNNPTSLHNYITISTKTIGGISLSTTAIALIYFLVTIGGIKLFSVELDNILIIATLVISVKFWELLYQSVLKGYERYDLASVYNILSKIVVLAAQFIIVYMGYGLLEIFISNLILNFLMVLIQAMIAYRLTPGYHFKFVKSKVERDNLFHFGLWTWLQTIISVLAYQIDRFIVAIFLGPATAGYYILASTIVNHMHMAFGAVVSWLLPKISRMKESNINITRYFTTLRSFSVGFGLLSILFTFLIYKPVFTIWLGEDKFSKMNDFFMLFLIFEAYLLMTIVPLFYLNAIKKLRFITLLELLYKSGVIVGLAVAFIITPTGNSLIVGQIVALSLLVPVEYYLINKSLVHDSWYNETLITMIPTVLLSISIVLSLWYTTLIFAIIAILVFKLYFLSKSRFEVKMLFE